MATHMCAGRGRPWGDLSAAWVTSAPARWPTDATALAGDPSAALPITAPTDWRTDATASAGDPSAAFG